MINMERDPLEEFIDINRSGFDQALPDHDLWNRIANDLPADTPVVPIRKPVIFQILKYAAAIAAIVGVSVFSTMQFMQSSSAEVSAEIITELNELTDFYDFEVNRKLTQLAAYGGNAEANKELISIDEVISDLKTELAEVPKGSEEKVINAMISNFKLKILILERMLEAKQNNSTIKENRNNEVNL